MKQILPLFKALSDRNRLRVMAALITHKELCACQITEFLQVTGATASRHLSVLIAADLIDRRKTGRWVFFRLKEDHSSFGPVLKWIQQEFAQDAEIQADLQALVTIAACDPEEICRKQRGQECCPT